MLPFGVTIPATVLQRSEIPEGLMNYPVSLHWSYSVRLRSEEAVQYARVLVGLVVYFTNFTICMTSSNSSVTLISLSVSFLKI